MNLPSLCRSSDATDVSLAEGQPCAGRLINFATVADVFLTYLASEDRREAEQIADLLKRAGFRVWWDRATPSGRGVRPSTIVRELVDAKCVLAIWSVASVRSESVRREADVALGRGVLVGVVTEKVRPPRRYAAASTFDLSQWSGEDDTSGSVRRLLNKIRQVVEARPPAARMSEPESDQSTPESAGLPGVFVCYRRDDTSDAAGRLHDHLASTFGRDRVFMDIDSVPLGVNFVTHIKRQLEASAAVLVVMGPRWIAATDIDGNRHLDDPGDHVRLEVATALKQDLPVIPVLVQNASIPRPNDLPEDIRDLAFHNGIKLVPEFWRAGVERLIKELDRVMRPSGGSENR